MFLEGYILGVITGIIVIAGLSYYFVLIITKYINKLAVKSKFDEDIRYEIIGFAIAMENKLKENDHKTHWHNLTIDELLDGLEEEVEELKEAIDQGYLYEDIKSECSDIGNYAMFIYDKLGGLNNDARLNRRRKKRDC